MEADVDQRIAFTWAQAQLIFHGKQLGYDIVIEYWMHCSKCRMGVPELKVAVFLSGIPVTSSDVLNRLHDYWDTVGGRGRVGELSLFEYR